MFTRKYSPSDLGQIIELFRATVWAVNAADYTAEQLAAWAPAELDLEKWARSLAENYTVIVIESGLIIGFGDMESNGHLDRLYIHKDYQRRGAATLITQALEDHAFNELGLDRIHTRASITARAFFIRRGYGLVGENWVDRGGQILLNYTMEKRR